jgi:single-strand DNA-binding protein
MNLLTAIGNISKDAELRFTPKGDAIASFSFALNSGYGDKQITTWLNCSVWGKRAETLAPMLLKGTKIGISGELTNRPYTAKDGTEKHSLDVRVNNVTLLGSKADANARQESKSQAQVDSFDDLDSNIPF